MSSHSGRNVMFRILTLTGVEFSTFHPDPLTHAYNAGAREKVGIPLRQMLIDAAPGEYMQMITENTKNAIRK